MAVTEIPTRAIPKSPFYTVFGLYVLLLLVFLVLVRFRVLFLFHLSLPLRLPPLLLPLLLTQGSCAADLYRHPQLDADIEAVKEIYSENSVSIRWGPTAGAAGAWGAGHF